MKRKFCKSQVLRSRLTN